MTSEWHPPTPIYSDYTYPPSPPLPPFVVNYSVVGLGAEPKVGITANGDVYAYDSAGQDLGRMRLSQNDLEDVLAQTKAIDSSTLKDNFIEVDTSGIRELDYRTLTVATADQSFTVTMRGNPDIPKALLNLESTLIDLAERAHTCAPSVPQIIIEYWLNDRVHVYGLQIDSTGGVYFGSHYAGHLAQENFETLVTFFKNPTFQNLRGPYTFNEKRDHKTEHRVIISYLGQDVNIFSGATIPHDMQIVLQLLADIHTQFYPTH